LLEAFADGRGQTKKDRGEKRRKPILNKVKDLLQ